MAAPNSEPQLGAEEQRSAAPEEHPDAPPAKRQKVEGAPGEGPEGPVMERRPSMHAGRFRVLAPMVRVGVLGFRQQCIRHGCELNYTEELIDRKLSKCTRRLHPGGKPIIEYFMIEERGKKKNRTSHELVVFSTPSRPPKGRPSVPVILQLGTNSKESALKAARLVEADVDGIDVNMGCPKNFSTKGGMGVALLKDRERSKEILEALCQNISKPISCKIRLFEDRQATFDTIEALLKTGISAIAIHARCPDDRNEQVPANLDRMREVVERFGGQGVPIILSGDIFRRSDFDKVQRHCGVSGAMSARGALKNLTLVFSESPLTQEQYIREFLRYALYYETPFGFVKYTMQRIMEPKADQAFYDKMQEAMNYEEMCPLFDVSLDHRNICPDPEHWAEDGGADAGEGEAEEEPDTAKLPKA